MEHKTLWIMSDGKPGHRNQSLGVADALGIMPHIVELKRRPLTGLLEKLNPTWGMKNIADLKADPAPDVLVATGTHLAPVAAWFKQQHPETFVVQIMPAGYANAVDLAVAFSHDRTAEAKNQMVVSTAPHRVSTAKLHDAHTEFALRFKPLPEPRLGVIIGGSNSTVKFTKLQAVRLASQVLELAQDQGFKSLVVTTSRRTGAEATSLLRAMFNNAKLPVEFYDPIQDSLKPNPYLGILALCDSLVVTAESFSMVSEALSSGKPTYLFGYRTWKLGKFKAAWDGLVKDNLLGCVHNPAQIPFGKVPNSAELIAEKIKPYLR